MTMASTAILRSVNGALLKAFDAWVAEFGMGDAASAFKMPSLIAEAIEADPELKEALFDWPVTLFVLDGGFGDWTVEKPPPGTLRRRSAKGSLWSGQEAFFLAVRENTQLTDCLLPQDFHLSDAQAALIRRHSPEELARLAQTPRPVLRFRDDLLADEEAVGISSLWIRALLFSTFVQDEFIDLDEPLPAE